MPILGAHQSIAGGYYRAVELAAEIGCQCVQLFTKNNNQWRAKPLVPDDGRRFQEALARLKVTHPVAHDSYLINLATPDETLWRQSLDSFVMELGRCEALGIPYLVTHPGSYTTSSEQAGLLRVVEALDETHRLSPKLKAVTLLENTAGQGTALGWRLEHLAAIRDAVKKPDRVAFCIDTCHLHAAGYPLSSEKDYRATMKELDRVLGIKLVKAIHLNDSKRELGARVDRHAHIGQGKIGLDGFRWLLNDRRFSKIPMYLETPKENEDGTPNGKVLDRMNLATLRSLVRPVSRAGHR